MVSRSGEEEKDERSVEGDGGEKDARERHLVHVLCS